MTPKALFSGARMAMKLARKCERSSQNYDIQWHEYMQRESRRHRQRAAGYLQSRAMLLRPFDIPSDRTA